MIDHEKLAEIKQLQTVKNYRTCGYSVDCNGADQCLACKMWDPSDLYKHVKFLLEIIEGGE